MCSQEFNNANPDKIISKIQQEIQKAEKDNSSSRLVSLRIELGRIYQSENNLEGALTAMDKALKAARESGDQELEAAALGAKGTVLAEDEQMDQAFTCFQQVRELGEQTENYALECDAFSSMGMVQLETGDPAAAIENFNAALKIARKNDDRVREMKQLSGLGNTYLHIAGEDEALHYFGQALEIAREIEDEQSRAGFLNNMALIHENEKQHEKSRELFEKVRVITNQIGDLRGELNALRHLINLYSGDNQSTDLILVFLKRAIALSEQLGDMPSFRAYTDALILVLLAVNQNQEALEWIDQELSDAEIDQFPQRKMELLINRGNACFDGKQFEDAEDAYGKAFVIARNLEDQAVKARLHGRLGAAAAELGNLAKAEEHAQKSLEIAQEIENQRLIVEQKVMLAFVNRDQGNISKAVAMCDDALSSLKEDSPDPLREKIKLLRDELIQQQKTG